MARLVHNEPPQAFGIVLEGVGGHLPSQPRIPRLVDLPHAARPQQFQHLIRTQLPPTQRGRPFFDFLGNGIQGRFAPKSPNLLVHGQQRFHLGA
jgi:hypothetical protein